MIMVVVGAHLRAEIDDRPLAYRLCDCMQRRSPGDAAPIKTAPPHAIRPTVCTDVWYLNNLELQERPVIALGEPGVNAATAYLCNRLPTALVIDNTLRIHLDADAAIPQACLWGANPAATSHAIDVFVERYLDGFLREAMDL